MIFSNYLDGAPVDDSTLSVNSGHYLERHLRQVIAEIEGMQPDDDLYDAKVKVLGEYIKHHVKEEEQPGGFFAQAKKEYDRFELSSLDPGRLKSRLNGWAQACRNAGDKTGCYQNHYLEVVKGEIQRQFASCE